MAIPDGTKSQWRGAAALSGSRTPHLQRRQGTYHLRVRVPDELRLRVGLLEVRRSLRVHTLSEARPLALAERLLPYEPSDPLFRQDAGANGFLSVVSHPAVLTGPSVQEAMDVYLAAGAKRWVGLYTGARLFYDIRSHDLSYTFGPDRHCNRIDGAKPHRPSGHL